MIEALTREWPFAIIEAQYTGLDVPPVIAAAAFLFTTEDGFAFVAPGYLDPFPGAQHYHRIEAEITPGTNVIEFSGPEYRGTITRYTGTIEQIRRTGVDMEWIEAELSRQGRSVDQERERLRELLQEDLQGRVSSPAA